jgi:thioredoxin 1
MEPIIGQLAAEMKGKATVVRVDIDDSPALAQKYHVTGIPCFIVFKGGKEVARQMGRTSKEELIDLLRSSP